MANTPEEPSFLGRPLWTGRPAQLRCPLTYKLAAASFGATSLVALLFSWVAGVVLLADVRPMVFFGLFAATIAIATWRIPIHLRERLVFTVTERHVGWRCGILRRSMERDGITYARIVWTGPGVGDLVLVRAVPTGALRRTLTLVFPDISAPDRVLATIRGAVPAVPAAASLPLDEGEKVPAAASLPLDEGEKVLWSAAPSETRWTTKQLYSSAFAVLLFVFAIVSTVRVTRPVARVLGLHELELLPAIAFLGAVLVGLALLFATAATIAWRSFFRAWFLRSRTRYLLTDRRVLITRGAEELSLDRRHIAYVIATERRAFEGLSGTKRWLGERLRAWRLRGAAPNRESEIRPSLPPAKKALSTDFFLVLDGPRSRGVVAAGAFGGGEEGVLLPVLTAIADAEVVRVLLGA